jgi:hypothetical protein
VPFSACFKIDDWQVARFMAFDSSRVMKATRLESYATKPCDAPLNQAPLTGLPISQRRNGRFLTRLCVIIGPCAKYPPCVQKVAQGSRGQRKLLLGHELMRQTPVPLFLEMWHGGPWRPGGPTDFREVEYEVVSRMRSASVLGEQIESATNGAATTAMK